MKHICATLLLLCNTLNGDLDLDFIEEVKACALEHNAIVESHERIPINLVLAQAIHESDWGRSRFATKGNNLFGIKALEGEDFIRSRSGKKLRQYYTWCESVDDYMDLLAHGKPYKEFQEQLFRQYAVDNVNIYELIEHLDEYAEDNKYKEKIKKLVKQMENL
jgi:Bax protein